MALKSLRHLIAVFLITTITTRGQETSYQKKAELLEQAFIEQNIKAIQKLVTPDVIFMLEYQRTLRGHKHIQNYYKSLFAQQNISAIKRNISETLVFDGYILEMGTFTKTLKRTTDQKELIHEGKFWQIWKKIEDEFLLFAYAEGYYRELLPDEYVVIDTGIEPENNGNIELRAYAALDEKAIREWNPEMRISMYTDDAVFYPFADSVKVGIETLRPYLKGFHYNDVKIELIHSKPFEFINFGNYVIQFSTFKVDWRFNEASGTNKGKGIKIWQRQSDYSLKIFRQIGLHNQLKF